MTRPRPLPASPLLRRAAIATIAVALAGCFTTAADFGENAENFILDDDDLRATVFPDSATRFESATCVEPENRDEDTTFPCTATDSNGEVWEFEGVITGSTTYEVFVTRQPGGS